MPSLRSNLKALPAPLWVLFAGTFINKFGGFVMPFLVLHMTRLGHTPAQAGLAVGMYGVGNLGASAIGGHLADRIGRRNTIALSMFLGAAAMLALSQAQTPAAIFPLTALLGLAAEFYRPASSALITDLVPVELRVTAFAVYRLAINAGFACGTATAGFLAEYSFQWLFYGDALTSFIFGWIALTRLPHGLRQLPHETNWRAEFGHVFRDRVFLLFVLANFPMVLVFVQMTTTLPLYVQDVGLSSATYGVLISLNGIAIILCELPLTAYTQRLPPRSVMALGSLLIGGGFALTGFFTTGGALAVTVLVWTLGEMLSLPFTSAYISGLAPNHLRGRYMGVSGATWALGFALGPVAGTWLYAHNRNALWIACALLGLFSAVMLLWGKPR